MINELGKIDSLAIDETDKSKLLLAVFDHLDWQCKKLHVLLLLEKLNSYVGYILDEGYKDIYQEDINSFQITVLAKHNPKRKLNKFLSLYNKSLKEKFPNTIIEVSCQLMEFEDT